MSKGKRVKTEEKEAFYRKKKTISARGLTGHKDGGL